MNTTKTLATLALAGLFGVAACNGDADLDANGTDAADASEAVDGMQGMDMEMMGLMSEFQQLQQQLGPIQEQAMQDEALAAQFAEISERVQTAMQSENPELFERMERLEADYMAAHEAGDEERMQAVGMEAQGMQMDLQALQAAVLDKPEIKAPIEAFEDAQRARMVEIDPEAGALIDRMEEIIEALNG